MLKHCSTFLLKNRLVNNNAIILKYEIASKSYYKDEIATKSYYFLDENWVFLLKKPGHSSIRRTHNLVAHKYRSVLDELESQVAELELYSTL